MKKYMGKIRFSMACLKACLLSLVLFVSSQVFAVGWTPTDGGLVVNLKPTDQILLSVWVDVNKNGAEDPGEEYFVENYTRYSGDGYFTYDSVGQFLKLVPQTIGATEPSEMSVWTIDTALTRVDVGNYAADGKNKDYALGGISYTMWNDKKTLRTTTANRYQFYGDLESEGKNTDKLCDVVFVVPTDHDGITSFDPNKTMERADQEDDGRFNGRTGTGFLGMTYREVYWLVIPRFNTPVSYTNGALVTFNTTKTEWNLTSPSGVGKVKSGKAAYSFADVKHRGTMRTVFRLYILNEPITTCPSTYFFAYDEQNTTKYRMGPKNKDFPSLGWGDSTANKKIYTMDRLFRMDSIEGDPVVKTGLMNVPVPDSSYYYVGWHDDYRNGKNGTPSEPLGKGNAQSKFTPIRDLPLSTMPSIKAPAGAYGRMLADTTSGEANLDVKFQPAGYFLKVSSGKNVRMKQIAANQWICEDMWTITDEWSLLSIKATLMTGSAFSETDPGVDIPGWSVMIKGTDVPLAGGGGGKVTGGATGWARIYTDNTAQNGNMEFVLANGDTCIHYDNNGFLGLQIPDQHPFAGDSIVTVEAARIKSDYEFTGWNTQPDGTGVAFAVGEKVDFRHLKNSLTLTNDTLYLYAQGTYDGTYNIAVSFCKEDGKRYFMTHPGTAAPRYSRARHYDDWTNVWQGMANAENVDPLYLNSFEMRHPSSEIKRKEVHDPEIPDLLPGEFVLDPRRYTMRGAVDSLTFYEYFMPSKDEFLGLYYAPGLNTILANTTWAGLFQSTSTATSTGWPDYKLPYIESTKLFSERYVEEYDSVAHPDSLELKVRANNATGTYVKYIPSTNQFDGCINPDTATVFQLTAIVVADEQYVILPDTTTPWRDEIVFDHISEAHPREQVWSKLIGKQLLACMMVDGDTIYFHPNRDKIYTTAADLRLSTDFRLTQSFTYINDSRVTSVDEEDRPTMMEAGDEFSRYIVGGQENPKNVTYMGRYIDIVDTLRIRLVPGGVSKIKNYYGRWKKKREDDGLHVNKDGSRYRDILVTTKTYHYGDAITRLVLTPEFDSYTFNPLANNSRTVNFTLTKETSHPLLDVENNVVGEEVIDVEDITTTLALGPGSCTFASGGSTIFTVTSAVGQAVILKTSAVNNEGDNHDTLLISNTVTIGAAEYPVTARIPLTQTSLEGDELIWSVVSGNQRYYITAGTGGLIFRKYKQSGSTLYKEGSSTVLVKGSANEENNDAKYITPWHFRYNPEDPGQLSLKTEYGVNRYLKMPSEATDAKAGIDDKDSSFFTFHYVNVYVNENANEEEQVKLQYGSSTWLKFDPTGGSGPELKLVNNENDASVFSWSYLLQEHSLLNNGTYPSRDTVTFGYNANTSNSVQTRYKAYKEYSMLVDNKVVYCCREDENDIADLINDGLEWKTNYAINLITDKRDFDGSPDPVSGISLVGTTESTLTTTLSTSGAPTSPTDVKIGGKYVNIVDTLHVKLTLDNDAPHYRFKDKWSSFKSIADAELKIPLVRKTYHIASYDSLACTVEDDEYNHTFPNTITDPVSYTFELGTQRRTGRHVLDVNNNVVAVLDAHTADSTNAMDLQNKALAEVRLMDEFGNTPSWCRISAKGASSVTVTCTQSGIRSPRTVYVYLAYIVVVDGKMRFVNYRLSVSQPSLYQYANNQHLVHSYGASGDTLDAKGMQQVHENKRILYYYPDQNVELPVRESHFFGWWRWFREGDGEIGDSDIPDSVWRTAPRNVGNYNYPFRIIGDSVWKDEKNHGLGKKLVTMGRYTVFHYRSKDYKDVRSDPPVKTALVAPPTSTAGIPAKPTVVYAVDISNYYDKLPMSVSHKNQVDTARLDTMKAIPEPTLSLREVFELRPWTEMAEKLEGFKSTRIAEGDGEGQYELASENYMEDHVMMAPLNNQLLLSTEQRYNLENLNKGKHSESLLGYYMRDDNWSSMSTDVDEDGWSRRDSMIWCGGWDADCLWYTYDPKTKRYTRCTHDITQGDDFLKVPAKTSITAGQEFDTVYYCLRARSRVTTGRPGVDEKDTLGSNMFNICRYMIIYHQQEQYGPKLEKNGKALITNDEIEQRYEVLERLNFDYNKPGSEYTIYPHPLPWADASYGYTYPETPNLPHNRLHDQSDFPNMGEYGLINRIGYTDYWHPMEQHGGAANGYMIYCDGMSSSGQVAALSLSTHLCSGQKMFFSGFVGNPSSQTGKANPCFTFDVQGSLDGHTWENITSYTTGDIKPSNQWYQIYFPIIFNEAKDYAHFRVRIYNMSSDWDGNDFIIDDMCLFATKPPLIAYQANTTCKEKGEEDKPTHVILRVDYQGITGEGYNDKEVFYTIKCDSATGNPSFVPMLDGYLSGDTNSGKGLAPDTIYGKLYIPSRTYEPSDEDSIFVNMNELIGAFDASVAAHELNPATPIYHEGYIYEILEGDIRPVKYIVHHAYMSPVDTFTVHMSAEYSELMSSLCGMTSYLKVSNQMVLELNGDEVPDTEQTGLCANATYNIGLRVKGSLYLDSIAPISLNGSCICDWLLYGDTAAATSKTRYGYTYKDIVAVVKDILRCEPAGTDNANQFAPNLAAVSRNEMQRIKEAEKVTLDTTAHPYDILKDLVEKGFLILYQPQVTATVYAGDSVQYVIFPILGTGSDAMHNSSVEVCPVPIFIKLQPDPASAKAPLIVGGLNRDPDERNKPVAVLSPATGSAMQIALKVDSIMENVGIRSIELLSTDDPEFREGVHTLTLLPDIEYPNETYYAKGDSIRLRLAPDNTYYMKQGYTYTFGIVMQTILGQDTVPGGCKVGTVPFNLSIVPNYLRWAPQDETSNQWNNPGNWIGINQQNQPLQSNTRFAPLASTSVIIPAMTDGMPYPIPPTRITASDSVQQVGFEYNICDKIRFLPGAAIERQENLQQNGVIIDMPLPHEKWAFRAAPVKGMLSGDIFMADADINRVTMPWEIGEFDAAGRNASTGNASYWLSAYSRTVVRRGDGGQIADSTKMAEAGQWSRVTNAMTLSLPPAQGWAIFTRTASKTDAAVRLPKNDDRYYYYNAWGERIDDIYEQNLQTMRDNEANPLESGHAGELAYQPVSGSQTFALSNDTAATTFVFGNPTMGYIDIWGFIADNGLLELFRYMDESGVSSGYRSVSKATADASTDIITNQLRYLPPMHAILIGKSESDSTKSLNVRLDTTRVITSVRRVVRAGAPRHNTISGRRKGIMTVTAVNPVSTRCESRLLIGQGYHDAILDGEDAILATINVDSYSNTSAPATPFNIYAAEGAYGLNIDLRDSVVNVPIAFLNTNLPYDPVTYLWFTGVNNIDGELVLYDDFDGSERTIADGVRLTIPTPTENHQFRYYIRRRGYVPQEEAQQDPITTGESTAIENQLPIVEKIIRNGHVLIIRNGQVYTMFGQQLK